VSIIVTIMKTYNANSIAFTYCINAVLFLLYSCNLGPTSGNIQPIITVAVTYFSTYTRCLFAYMHGLT